MKLINFSNHSSSKWSKSQKEGFEEIIDIKFPEIPTNATTLEVVENFVRPAYKEIKHLVNKLRENSFVGIMLQGEFTFSYLLFNMLKSDNDIWNIYIPCTERKVQEITNSDGTVTKSSIFEFVGWRII